MKKYHFGVKLQSRELNLVLRKTAMIVREVPLGLGQFRKSPDFFEYSPDFKVFRVIMQDKSNIICSTSMKIQ